MVHLPANTGLVLIDIQKGFDDPFWGTRNNPQAEANIARLLAGWRAAGQPIFHVYHNSRPGRPLSPGQPGNDPKPEAQPLPGEPQYRKTVNSALIGTALEADLRAAGIDTLVIIGITTNHCVSTTARMAGNLGFTTYVIEDATAAFDKATVDGRMRPAQDVHDAALSDLHGEFATVISTDQALAALPGA